MLHATVLMCWLGAGCMFWVADEAFDNVKACEIKVEEVVVAVIDANGAPSLADPKCMTVVIKRIIDMKGNYVYDCYNCKDQIAKEAVLIFV